MRRLSTVKSAMIKTKSAETDAAALARSKPDGPVWVNIAKDNEIAFVGMASLKGMSNVMMGFLLKMAMGALCNAKSSQDGFVKAIFSKQ